jgi:hypothetical protein
MAVAALLVIASGVLVVASVRAGTRFMPSLNLAHPELGDASLVLGHAPPRLARRVILIIVDGLRLDAAYGRPFLDGLRTQGIDAAAKTHFPSLSRPNYVSIVTGVEPRWSGVRTNDYERPVTIDSVMARARAAGMQVSFVTDGADGFPAMFSRDLDAGVLSGWPGGLESATKNAAAGASELVILLPTGIDEAGHGFGAASPEYREAARQVDGILERALADVDLEKDAIIAVADHGHVDRGGHGGIESEVLSVPLVLAGAGIERGATLIGAEIIDVAPTVAALLGLPAPGHALGKTWVDALAIEPKARDLLRAADQARLAQLLPVVEKVARQTEFRAAASHFRRGPLVLSFLAVLVAFAVWATQQGILLVDRRVWLIGLPAFPLTFYGMTLAMNHWMSPSMMPGRGAVTDKLFLYGAIAALVNLVASWFALHSRRVPRQRLAAAAGLTFLGLVVAMAPAGAAWALADTTFAVALPGPRMLMIPPVTYSAVACYALSATLIMTLEYVVFLARASDPRRFL